MDVLCRRWRACAQTLPYFSRDKYPRGWGCYNNKAGLGRSWLDRTGIVSSKAHRTVVVPAVVTEARMRTPLSVAVLHFWNHDLCVPTGYHLWRTASSIRILHVTSDKTGLGRENDRGRHHACHPETEKNGDSVHGSRYAPCTKRHSRLPRRQKQSSSVRHWSKDCRATLHLFRNLEEIDDVVKQRKPVLRYITHVNLVCSLAHLLEHVNAARSKLISGRRRTLFLSALQ